MRRLIVGLLILALSTFGAKAQLTAEGPPSPVVVTLGDQKPVLIDSKNFIALQLASAKMLQNKTIEGYRKYHPFGAAQRQMDVATPYAHPLNINLFSAVTPIAPAIVSLTASPATGSYGSGQAFTFTLQANQPVNVSGGTPTITLDTTPSTTTASYCGGTGTVYLAFCYTAGSNLASPLGTTSNAYTANGATLSTANGNLPTTALNSVVFTGLNIVAGGSGPTVVGVTASPSSGTWATGVPITIYVQFSGNITLGGTGSPTLNLNTSPGADTASCPVASGAYLICAYTVGSNSESPLSTTSAAITLGSATISGTGGSANLTGANNQALTGLVVAATAACSGTQYNVSTAGNDGASGKGPSNAWATPAHAQAQAYGPNDCLSFNGNDAQALGYISGNTLTVTTLISGTIHVNDTVAQPDALIESWISAEGSGTGGTGTYTIGGDTQTVGSSSQPVFITFGQNWQITSGVGTDGNACFTINSTTNVTSNSGNFQINTYGGPTVAFLSSSTCASSDGGVSSLADIDGVNATWNGINLYANGQTQTYGLQLLNYRGSAINTITVKNMACVGMNTYTGNGNDAHCIITLPQYNITSVTIEGVTATGGSVSSNGDEGITYLGDEGTVGTYIVQGFECKEFGGRNVSGNTGSCVGSTAVPGSAFIQYGFIHDMGWNVRQCGGISGLELYTSSNFTVQYLEIYNTRPSSWASGSASPGCDDDGLDFDGGTSNNIAQYIYSHDNFGTGLYGWVNNVGASNWGPNIWRYNISVNDGYGQWPGNRIANIGFGGGGTVSGCGSYYNNTVLTTNTGSFAFQGGGTPGCGYVANNIFAVQTDGSGNNDFMYFYTGTIPGISFKSNAYVSLNGSGTFRVYQYGGNTYTTFSSWQAAAPGGETGSFTAFSSPLSGTVLPSVICGPSGNGIGRPLGGQNIGPQPCPSAYKLVSGSTAYIGTGYAVPSPGANDYYGDTIPNGVGTGYNIGADGGNP